MNEQTNKHNQRTMLTLLTSMIAMVVMIGTNFFLSPYIVKTLGEEANGFTQLANNFVNYASLITVALNSMAGRFVTINFYKGDIRESNKFYSSVMIVNIVIICLLIVPASILLISLENVINISEANVIHVKVLFAFVFGNFFITQINSVFGIATYVSNKQYMVNTVNTMKTIINALCLLFVFSLFTAKIYYVSMVAAILSLITIPVYFYISRKLLPDLTVKWKYFSLATIKTVVFSGIWNVVIQCGSLLMTGVDLLLANLYLGPVAMGVLSVSKVMPNCIVQVAGNVNTSFSPHLTIAYAEDDFAKVLNSLRYAMKCSSILVSIPIMVLCIYGESFYSLWQPTLDAKTLSLLSFLACVQFIPFAGPQVLNNIFTSANKLKLNSLTVLIGGIANVILVIWGIKNQYGGLLLIASVSAIVSIVRNLIFTVPYVAKILKLKWYTFYKDVVISCFCCLANGIFCILFQELIVPSSWMKLVLSIACSCIVSFSSLFFVLLTKKERKTLIHKVRRN